MLEDNTPNEEMEENEDSSSNSEQPTVNKTDDKIFNNNFNQGSLDLDYNRPLQVDLDYQDTYLGNSYNPTEYAEHQDLLKKVFDLIEESEWAFLIKKKKKVTNDNIPKIFIYLKSQLNVTGSSNIEIFTAISDALDIPFKTLYDNIGAKFKEELLFELDNKLGIFKRKKIKRLF